METSKARIEPKEETKNMAEAKEESKEIVIARSGEEVLKEACKAYQIDRKYILTFAGYRKNDDGEYDQMYKVLFNRKGEAETTINPIAKEGEYRIDAVRIVTHGGTRVWYVHKDKTLYRTGVNQYSASVRLVPAKNKKGKIITIKPLLPTRVHGIPPEPSVEEEEQ